jgi:hypothetical protein
LRCPSAEEAEEVAAIHSEQADVDLVIEHTLAVPLTHNDRLVKESVENLCGSEKWVIIRAHSAAVPARGVSRERATC